MLLISLATIAITQTKVLDKITLEKEADYVTYIASAYCLQGKMADGSHTRQGVIATDPRIIPTGSVVYILGMGTFIATDTGGKIKNNRIDIWMNSRYNAIKFGMKKVKLRIISYGNNKKNYSQRIRTN